MLYLFEKKVARVVRFGENQSQKGKKMEEKNYLTKINEVCTSPTVAVHFDSPG
jgi:hypothetical protein